MSNNQDFTNLIDRVEVATEQLELSVGNLDASVQDVEDKVIEAQMYSQQALTHANNSSQSATDSAISEQAAEEYRDETQLLLDTFKGDYVVGEAPKNGQQYARKDGVWSLLEPSEGGGGTVVSVNGNLPDEQGDVTLAIPELVNADWEAVGGDAEILNKPTLFSGSYLDLTNTPTIPTEVSELTNDLGFIGDAPSDGTSYVRKDADWVEAESGGGGGGVPFPVVSSVGYDGSSFTEWVDNNPYTTAELGLLGGIVGGRPAYGFDLFSNLATLNEFPDGAYSYTASDASGVSGIANTTGVVYKSNGFAFAIAKDGDAPSLLLFNPSGSTSTKGSWEAMETGGGGGDELGYPTGKTLAYYDDVLFTHWVSPSPHTPAILSFLGSMITGRMKYGIDLFTSQLTLNRFPDGIYAFTGVGDVTGTALVGHSGVIHKLGNYTYAIAKDNTTDEPKVFYFKPNASASNKGSWEVAS